MKPIREVLNGKEITLYPCEREQAPLIYATLFQNDAAEGMRFTDQKILELMLKK